MGGEDDTHEDRSRDAARRSLAARPYLFVVLEANRPLAGGARYLLDDVDEVVIARGTERGAARERADGLWRLTLRLPSRSLSSVHARLRRETAGWQLLDARSTNGTYLNGTRVEGGLVADGDVIEAGRVFLALSTQAVEAEPAPADLDRAGFAADPGLCATLLPELARRGAELERVAASPLTIVLSGETGTGKEHLASAIHARSGRAGPLVAINCGTLSDAQAEARLFGAVAGFSGALRDTAGLVRSAEGGTLLLDEVQELGRTAQAALLRVLEQREVAPVGGSAAHKVDVRFVATCPYPLHRDVQRGKLRPDLFARLAAFTHRLPPLRERRSDLGLLIAALLRKAGVGEAERPSIAPDFAAHLFAHDWPLNIRELEQLVTRRWMLARNGVLELSEAESARGDGAPAPAPAEPVAPARALTTEEQALRERVTRELERASGNVSRVARSMGKAPMQVHRWMKRFGIDPQAFRRRGDGGEGEQEG